MRSESAVFLTPADVRNIQQYVMRKYAGLPSDRHAEIVTDAIRRIVMKQLPAFGEEERMLLTGQLLDEVVARQQIPVGAEHVFAACLRRDESAIEWLDTLRRWTEERLRRLLDPQRFNQYIRQARAQLSLTDVGQELQSGQWLLLVEEAALWEEIAAAETVVPDTEREASLATARVVPYKPWSLRERPRLYALLSALVLAASFVYGWMTLAPMLPQELQPPVALRPVEPKPAPIPRTRLNELPNELRYADVDVERLTEYLDAKNSLLAEAEHRDIILKAAHENDIHPLLLFAITGQEQAFVPKSHKLAKKMINNPFNVFHSYQEYNTTLEDSARIASETVNKWSKNRPEGVDAIKWVNRKYAEDPNWAKGVTSIFRAMKRYVEHSE
ncbi:glucosaminidase domain-containing protein [Paenibacillus methanolicus]|uniref:Mannosyl-glycoprotein endo-beta-N-acetylglucosaminidase n=1 Tax=Paenibacillus methanolicus TaxID=582686 RepID=A0A5S5BZZ6_9BACL|nr:glucosaminidase domain-containing protein [Paenibacillus methanolicus]TYP72519.1 mannosyl-glycoprotein endo-beta-N-acetylglucosaminidase [Paenibacillus methanolicus]